MSAKIAGIVIGLAAAALLAAAHASAFAKPPAGKKSPAAAKPAASATVKHSATANRRKGKASDSGPSVAELVSANAARPQAERLAIESDLVAGKGAGGAIGWRLIDDPATGARLAVPEKLVPRSGAARIGSRWTSAQGQIQIETFRLAEAALPALFEDEKKAAHREVESSVLAPSAFTISGVQGLKNFVVRVESGAAGAAGGNELRGVTILYDQATAGIMGPVAVAVASAFTGFPDPNAVPLPGMRRGVEYGTAIVVSTHGDLLASAQVTEACQALTVPGRGHAERIAADKTSGLALIRLYGARKLVPAALAGAGDAAGAGNASGDLTLVGIADPAVEAGAGAVIRLASHLTAQGIEPTPKPGFSGAAAIDARGRFAGMVDLKPPLPTAGGAAAAFTLVPADVIRGFLRAQGIAPNGTAVGTAAGAAGDPAIEQSVLRVICVRK